MRIRDWSSDVCSSDLNLERPPGFNAEFLVGERRVRTDDFAYRALRGRVSPLEPIEGSVAERDEIGQGFERIGLVFSLREPCAEAERLLGQHGALSRELRVVDEVAPPKVELGRAASRESEWRYVSISVGAVSLQK